MSFCRQEEERKMRSLAVIPPMLLDDNQKKLRFFNNNGLLDDPKSINEDTVSKTNYWTDTEKEIFREKYLHRPKNFGYISSSLHNKVWCRLFLVIALHQITQPSLLWVCLQGSDDRVHTSKTCWFLWGGPLSIPANKTHLN